MKKNMAATTPRGMSIRFFKVQGAFFSRFGVTGFVTSEPK
jgi:hypothetical protein